MREKLLLYYERELRFIRRMTAGFAEKHPDVAGRLMLGAGVSEDPHVERIIESFAMLAARVHLRLDDDFSEVSDALLDVLYPHYLRPIPSMTICQFGLDPEQGGPGEGLPVPRHSLLRTRRASGTRCVFRTCYPVKLWPIKVAAVQTDTIGGPDLPPDARSVLRIRLEAEGNAPLADLSIDALRFFLDDEGRSLKTLYEMFVRDAVGLQVRWGPNSPVTQLGVENIRQIGFAADENVLEYPRESFVGYRLLQEYFAFPDKFLFVELGGIDRSRRGSEQTFLELGVLMRQSAADIDVRFRPQNLRLNCTPIVNLFPHRPDPIRLKHTEVEYKVDPDPRAQDAYEVYSIDKVETTAPGSDVTRTYHPFYALRHGVTKQDQGAFWFGTRRESLRKDDPGTDVFLALVDPRFEPLSVDAEVLHLETLCTNRDLPSLLAFTDPRSDFQIDQRAEIATIACLRKPTAPLRAPMGRDARWRIVSHLALNHLSLVANEGDVQGSSAALAALREILKVYDFADSPTTRQRIAGLIGLRTRDVVRRIGGSGGFARGVEVQIELDEDQYAGNGALLFASVLERFFGLYTSINSFTQTVAHTRQRTGVLKKWPPRAGEKPIL